jgi:hypothetical protein
MAHYAFLNENNIVTEVITGIDETELIEGVQPEIWYGNYRNQICKRTSYNGNIRGTFAGVGYFYDEDEDIFIVPQPYPSWSRIGSFWKAPIDCPQDEKLYIWDENILDWIADETSVI